MFTYDYCFCTHEECEDRKCFRHPEHIPIGEPVSIADLREDPVCPHFGEVSDTETLIKKIERMSVRPGEILCLFYDPALIDADEIGEIAASAKDAVQGGCSILALPTSVDVASVDAAVARKLIESLCPMGE